MTFCEYYDCGWCYAPDDVETSASSQSACFYPDYCPYLKSQMSQPVQYETPMTKSKITLELTLEELKLIDKYVELNDDTRQLFDKIRDAYPKSKTLTDLIHRWWEDIFSLHSDWDSETSIDDLIDQIQLWLPKEQSAAGSQNAYVECSVEGFNDAIKQIKSKLR